MKKILPFLFVLLCYGVNTFAQDVKQSNWDVAVYSIFDGERRIYYSDVADAETKILEYYDEICKKNPENHWIPLPYKLFTELVLHDSRAFRYDFSRFIEASKHNRGTVRTLRIIESPDRRMRLYTWDEHGGTMTAYSGITSISLGNSVFSNSTYHDEETGLNYTDDFPEVASGAYAIQQFIDVDGETVYAVYTHSSGSNMMQHQQVCTYKIRDNFIERAPVFEEEDGLDSGIGMFYSPEGYYCSDIECVNGDFFLPVTRENDLNLCSGNLFTGRSIFYKWDGKYFRNNGFVYRQDDGLYPALRNYEFHVAQIDFKKWTIRIDKMPNGAFRYASWKSPKTTNEIPDLVLEKGNENASLMSDDVEQKKFRYTFRNYKYSYVVSWESHHGYFSCPELVVMKDNNVLVHLSSGNFR